MVKEYVHEWRLRSREMFVPLRHDPGHAQVDFGEALAVIGGVERKIHFFALDLSHSDACLVQAYPHESSEAFCEGRDHGGASAKKGVEHNVAPRTCVHDCVGDEACGLDRRVKLEQVALVTRARERAGAWVVSDDRSLDFRTSRGIARNRHVCTRFAIGVGFGECLRARVIRFWQKPVRARFA